VLFYQYIKKHANCFFFKSIFSNTKGFTKTTTPKRLAKKTVEKASNEREHAHVKTLMIRNIGNETINAIIIKGITSLLETTNLDELRVMLPFLLKMIFHNRII
jgi:hypothetical protein